MPWLQQRIGETFTAGKQTECVTHLEQRNRIAHKAQEPHIFLQAELADH